MVCQICQDPAPSASVRMQVRRVRLSGLFESCPSSSSCAREVDSVSGKIMLEFVLYVSIQFSVMLRAVHFRPWRSARMRSLCQVCHLPERRDMARYGEMWRDVARGFQGFAE